MVIGQCISGFLLAKGDPATIGDLNSLKDRLKIIRRQAVAVFHEAPTTDDPETNLAVNRGMNLDNVFGVNPEGDSSHLHRTLPSYLPRRDPDLNSSCIAVLPESIGGTTVVASRSGNRIIAEDTGLTYSRQYPEPEKLKLIVLTKHFPTSLELALLM